MPGLLPDLSIRQLEYLVAVADSPTWATAAAVVGVSPSALSQGLAELERRVGIPLFDRIGRRRVIRPGVEAVLTHARQVVALTGDLNEWAIRTRGGAIGRLRVGMIDAAAVAHFSEDLRDFKGRHPDIDMHLVVAPSGSLLDALTAGTIDMAVCVQPPSPVRGIDTVPLLVEDLAVYGPDERVTGPPIDWGPWVMFPEGSHTRLVTIDALTALGSPIEIVAESHQPEVLRAMVGLGLGWTVLPVVQCEGHEPELTRGRIVASRRIVVATRNGAAVDPSVDLLERVLRRERV